MALPICRLCCHIILHVIIAVHVIIQHMGCHGSCRSQHRLDGLAAAQPVQCYIQVLQSAASPLTLYSCLYFSQHATDRGRFRNYAC